MGLFKVLLQMRIKIVENRELCLVSFPHLKEVLSAFPINILRWKKNAQKRNCFFQNPGREIRERLNGDTSCKQVMSRKRKAFGTVFKAGFHYLGVHSNKGHKTNKQWYYSIVLISTWDFIHFRVSWKQLETPVMRLTMSYVIVIVPGVKNVTETENVGLGWKTC